MAKNLNQSVSDEAYRSVKLQHQTGALIDTQVYPYTDICSRAVSIPTIRQSSPQVTPIYASPDISLSALSNSDDPLVILQRSMTNQSITKMVQTPNLHREISDTSRLKSLNHENQKYLLSSDHRQIPRIHEVMTKNYSRPSQPSLKGQQEQAWPQNTNNVYTPALPKFYESQFSSVSLRSRNTGLSSEATEPTTPTTISILRQSSSIPDYQTIESVYIKQKNSKCLDCRPNRSFTKLDCKNSPESSLLVLRDPLLTHIGTDGEGTRSSFRSGVTINSSFLGTSGTERSSVLTKSSSKTSIFGRDESLNVDTIGMYEQGFSDSDVDDNHSTRPQTGNSEKNILAGYEPEIKEFLVFPPRNNVILHDSATIFETCKVDSSILSHKEEVPIAVKETDLEEEASPSRPVTRSAITQFDDTRDRYGFRKKTPYVSLEEYESWNKPYTVYLARRKKKWITLMRHYNLPTIDPQEFPPRSDKIKRFIRKGIPPSWRGAAWFHYAGGPAMLSKYPGVYDDLVKRSLVGDMTPTDEEIIERDLNRTFPDNIKFKPDTDPNSPRSSDEPIETPILKSLRRVLRAFSIYHPKIGYCQSLNFLAGLLLLFMSEEKAFWMLNIITRIFLPGTHSLNLEGANVDLGVLMSSIKQMIPSVWAKIGNEFDGQPSSPSVSAPMRLPPITLCTTAWFMSCFIGTLPIETTLRVWDSFFYEGSKTLFRIALTIFKLGEPQIRAVTDPMEIFQVVQSIPRGMMDCNRLMETCFKRRGGFVKLSQDEIERGREERRRGYAEERERIAKGADTAIIGVLKSKESAKRGNTLFGRSKKGRIGLPVQV